MDAIDARIVATHRVMIGEVKAMRVGIDQPALVYHGRGFHRI